MGKFNGKISAEFTPPRTWILEKSLSFETEHLNNDDIEILTQVGAKVEDTGKGTGKVTCGKGMKTDLASVPRAVWAFIAPWDVARAAVIHDHMYAKLRNFYWHGGGKVKEKKIWKQGRYIADKVFLHGMKSAEPKVSGWKIWACYRAVRIFGRWAASAKE